MASTIKLLLRQRLALARITNYDRKLDSKLKPYLQSYIYDRKTFIVQARGLVITKLRHDKLMIIIKGGVA